MRKVPQPVVTEERGHPKKRISGIFTKLFLEMMTSETVDGKKLFRGSNLGHENPIFIPNGCVKKEGVLLIRTNNRVNQF